MKTRIGLVMAALIGVFTVAGCGSGGPSATDSDTAVPGATTGRASTIPSTAGSDAPAGGATGHATSFNDLTAQWNGSSFSFQGTRLTFKAVYTGVATSSLDCTGRSQNVTIEQNQDDSLIAWPGCAEAISTPSGTYTCQLTAPVKCGVGDYPDPFSSFVGQNFSASAILASLESEAPQFLTSAQTTYSHADFAGQPSTCVSYGYTPSTSSRICVTSNGLLAFLGAPTAYAPAGASGTVSLTSYSSSAPTSDFAPPAGASLSPYAGPRPTSGTG